jgi:hypothetical protein
MTDEQLAKLIADDNLGLLTVKPKRTPKTTEEERLLAGFQDLMVLGVAESGDARCRLESLHHTQHTHRPRAARRSETRASYCCRCSGFKSGRTASL